MLELALALPMLLMVMALIINFGTAAAWKVRDLTMARHALWQTRWQRTAQNDPRPAFWPSSASTATSGPVNLPELDDSRVNQPVARGPLPAAWVDGDLLDATRGFRQGEAGLTRDFPLLARLGPYRLQGKACLLDDQWQFPRMKLQSNTQRRIPALYQLAKAPPGLASAYLQAVETSLFSPIRQALAPLDRFYPSLVNFCTTNPAVVDERVSNLVDRIQGNPQKHIPSLPEEMASALGGP
jgi:hypothetical protein